MWNFEQYGSSTALKDDRGNTITYNELDRLQHQFANNIVGHNKNRILIFIICTNTIESILAYISCINNHIVPFLISSEINNNALDNLCSTYLPNYIWMPSEMPSTSEIIYNFMGYKLLRMSSCQSPINDNLALLLSTSGSTGSRKAVRISYKNIETNTIQIVKALAIGQEDRAVTMLPMNYTYGLSVINTHLYAGAMLLVTDKKVFGKSFWQFFNDNRGTSISGVAYTYKILKKLGFEKWKIPYLKKITQAGEKLPLDLYRYLEGMVETRNINFHPMYGQTEATARITIMPEGMAKYKTGSTGVALEGGIIEIVNDAGQQIVEHNRTGRVMYRGKNVAMGYAQKREELQQGDLWNGRLDTGDYGYLDEDGYLFIEGRRDAYVKVAGNRVSLQELEEMLEEKFIGSEFCVRCRGGKIRIAQTNADKNEVIKYVANITGLNRNMVEIKSFGSIPMLDNGKVDRNF